MSTSITPISAPQSWNQTLSRSLSQPSDAFFRLLNSLQSVDPNAANTATANPKTVETHALADWQSQYFHQSDLASVRLLNALYDAPAHPITHKNGFPHSVHHNLSYALQRDLAL